MNDNVSKYTYRVFWSEEDKEYVGLCSEFPSLSWLDKDHSSAMNGIIAVVSDVVAEMLSNNEEIPDPISLQKFSGKFVVRVPEDTHRRLYIEAKEQMISLNRLVSQKLAI